MIRNRATQERRDREFAAARTAEDVDALQQRWMREDDAHAAAEDWRTRSIADLKRRLVAVEKVVGPGGKGIVDALVGAIGAALRRVRQEEREHTAAAISKALSDAAVMRYAGIWTAERSYPAGSCVTTGGSMWIATGPCAAGDKPGHGPGWRLCVKQQGKGNEPTLR